MKKSIFLLFGLFSIILASCYRNDGKDISIKYTDSEDSYSMNALFGRSRTRAAELYMNKKIGQENNISFLNTQSDAVFTLDDGSKFYLKKSPGFIEIKLNKKENSFRAYHTIKSMCEGMKNVLVK